MFSIFLLLKKIIHRMFFIAAFDKYFARGAGAGPVENMTDIRILQRRFSRCGLCHNLMDLKIGTVRAGVESRCLACSACNKSFQVPLNGELSAHEKSCPICNFQVVSVLNTDKGTTYTLCPKCFREPPPPPFSIEGELYTSGFSCFKCVNTACSLASNKSVSFSPCPEPRCQGQLHIRKSEKNHIVKFFAGCNKYPQCNFR
jgi:DNA topoisomerase-3